MVNLMLAALELVPFAKKVTSCPTYTLEGDATRVAAVTSAVDAGSGAVEGGAHANKKAAWPDIPPKTSSARRTVTSFVRTDSFCLRFENGRLCASSDSEQPGTDSADTVPLPYFGTVAEAGFLRARGEQMRRYIRLASLSGNAKNVRDFDSQIRDSDSARR
jgi:hypothetical protein